MAQYCSGSSRAIVNYKVDGTSKIYEVTDSSRLPIDVSISNGLTIAQTINKVFDGSVLTTYPFTVNSPANLESNISANIYLLSGSWDDCGNIGSFNAPCTLGQTYTYSGGKILVGTGNSIQGTVINLMTAECNVTLNLSWEYSQKLLLIKDKNNNLIYSEAGTNITYTVQCSDACPDGYCKCTSNIYPGYCCLDCKEIASKINSITQSLRQSNDR